MATATAPYPAYRPTGVEWVEQVPEHWRNSSLGFECSVKARLGWRGLKAEEYVDDGYIFLATPNIKGSGIDFENVNYITRERYNESPEIMLEEGDVLVTKDGSTTGTTNLVRHLPRPATVNSSIAVLRSFGGIASDYLFYFFTSDYVQNVINRMRGGMGVPHLFQADLWKFFVCIQSSDEQTQIAKFLDHETARIDALIEKQQQLIALLQEKRQAVISHAVTKGLNPDAPMRDSGVEWLGKVPAHWTTTTLKYHARVIDCKHITAEFVDDGIPVASIGEVRGWLVELTTAKQTTEAFYQALIGGDRDPRPGDILFTRNATVGETSMVPSGMPKFAMGQDVCLIRPAASVHTEFVLHCLKSPLVARQLDLAMIGSTFKRVNVDDIRNFAVTLPPVDEQREIAVALAERLPRYDALIGAAEQTVDLLSERRTALISVAVTGKIDVRNWTAPTHDVTAEVA